MSQRVQFLICGAQKAGTTALAGYLKRHPQLELPGVKEPHFFDRETLDWQAPAEQRETDYHAMFAPRPGCLWGESTPVYLYWKPSAERIWRYNPSMKLIVLLRNPISRAYSHWNMERQRGRESMDFFQAIQQEAERCREASPLQHRVYSYVDRGFYSAQLERLWHWFGREAVLVMRQEDLLSEANQCLEHVYQHLGVQSIAHTGPLHLHQRRYAAPMPEEAKAWLIRRYESEIACLEKLLGWNCQHWLEA